MQLAGLLLASCCAGAASAATSTPPEPLFELQSALAEPVIDKARAHALPRGPNSGFEGGLYFRAADGVYHLFPSECMLDRPKVPWDIHMESHDWTSPVSQRHLPPYFLGHFSPVSRRLFAVLLRFPASWRRDGENGRKMA